MNPKIRNQAFQLLQKNKFTDAIPLLLKVVKKDSNDMEACFALASAYAQANRPHEAEKYLKHVFLKSPDNAQACYALAYTQESIGQYDAAIQNFNRLLTLTPEQFDTYNHLGNIHLIQGDFSQAEINFIKYLKHDANNLDVLNNLGIIYMELEKYQQAETIFTDIIAKHPRHTHAINNLGNLNKSKGDFDAAEKCFQNVLNIDSTHVEAKYNWSTILVKNNHYTQAIELLNTALQAKPVYNKASILLAKAYQATNHLQEALQTIISAITSTPNSIEAYQCFAGIVSNLTLSDTSEELENILINAFDNKKVDHNLLVKPLLGIINGNEIAASIKEVNSKPEDKIAESLLANGLANIFSHNLLITLLQKTIVSDAKMELFLTKLRYAVLICSNMERKLPNLGNKLELICSLAMQCYNTEYVYNISEKEKSLTKKLLNSIEHINKNNLFKIAVLASYLPLNEVLSTTQINELTKVKKPPTFNYLIEQQISAPALEEELKSNIISLSDSIDDTSKDIMSINEDAPYPRWISTNIHNNKITTSSIYSQLGLAIPENDNASCFEILIAGCGTGKHSIEIASNYSNSHVTAVDISYNSLAYATRKNQEYNVSNLDYYHADLLNLSAIEKQYDMIEVSGVLHHFSNPSEMLGKLIDILKSSGIIKIGAYSQRVREPINKIQKEVINRYSATPEGIRDARQYVINNCDLDKTGLKANKDFYSLSGCRYLLFGANDHNFTFNIIKQLINEFNLTFLGFDIDDKSVLTKYKKQFPDDPAMLKLDNWDQFEMENPKTFSSMYQFKCQKT